MRRLTLPIGLLLLAAAAAMPFVTSGGTAHAATANVRVADTLAFIDATSGTSSTTIHQGDTVVWTWDGGNFHSVTSDTGTELNSPTQMSGTFSHTFASAGAFTYHCQVHPVQMTGTVTVLAASTPTNTTLPATSTNTPVSAPTATGTSGATGTATMTAVASATPMPQTTRAAATATKATGAAGAGTSLPRTGDGASSSRPMSGWIEVGLALAGIVVVATGLIWRRRGA